MSFHHVALNVHNIEQSTNFYTNVFGMKIFGRWKHIDKNIVMLEIPQGGFLELHEVIDDFKSSDQFWHISFSPKDINDCYKLALEHGATEDRPPFMTVIKSYDRDIKVKIAWLFGPEQEKIELFCPIAE